MTRFLIPVGMTLACATTAMAGSLEPTGTVTDPASVLVQWSTGTNPERKSDAGKLTLDYTATSPTQLAQWLASDDIGVTFKLNASIIEFGSGVVVDANCGPDGVDDWQLEVDTSACPTAFVQTIDGVDHCIVDDATFVTAGVGTGVSFASSTVLVATLFDGTVSGGPATLDAFLTSLGFTTVASLTFSVTLDDGDMFMSAEALFDTPGVDKASGLCKLSGSTGSRTLTW